MWAQSESESLKERKCTTPVTGLGSQGDVIRLLP